ncbi:MAG: hydroxymethylglutaryl-CoA lyase [Pseudomonadales bacterium]
MTQRVIINEVGPRDGLQNQSNLLSPAERLRLIQALVYAGIDHLEVGSFVSPKAVPAMAGTDQVMARLPEPERVYYSVLVPNQRGYDLARQAGARNVALVLSASDSMSQKNIRMSKDEVFDVACDIIRQSKEHGIDVLAYISVAFECPFEGKVDPQVVRQLTTRILEQGAKEVIIADTIGAANPGQVRALLNNLVDAHGAKQLSCHFHDTRAMALANVYAALESGIRKFDSAIGGLGGCPFAPGAAGNLATEDVVMMLEQMGFSTGIDLSRLLEVADLAAALAECPGPRAKAWLEREVRVAT